MREQGVGEKTDHGRRQKRSACERRLAGSTVQIADIRAAAFVFASLACAFLDENPQAEACDYNCDFSQVYTLNLLIGKRVNRRTGKPPKEVC